MILLAAQQGNEFFFTVFALFLIVSLIALIGVSLAVKKARKWSNDKISKLRLTIYGKESDKKGQAGEAKKTGRNNA